MSSISLSLVLLFQYSIFNNAFTFSSHKNGYNFLRPRSRMRRTYYVEMQSTKSSTKEKPRETRLDKAERMLSELQLDYDYNFSEEKGNGTVPDSFWRNGHLEYAGNSSNQRYVTRWARGQKVAEPLIQYDPVLTEKRLFRQPAKWLIRNVQIAFPLSLWVWNLTLDYILGNEQLNRRARAKQLLATISKLGPAIIKGGQALSSRPDLMPSEYLEELQKLQDDVPRYENVKAFEIVEEELKINFTDTFELLEKEPVAAASIGQVYKARLLSNNSTVALKIQRPQCESIIALDLYILRWWSGLANILILLFDRDINLVSVIDDFGVLIYRELDYVAEAANAQRFAELYSSESNVYVPKIYSDITTNKVLVMEWVDGFRLTDNLSLDAYDLDKKKMIQTLIQCELRQILENGFFHADPHAGNLLATPDGRLCYLDFGMMSYAAANQRNGFLLAVVHLVNGDWNELVKLYVKMGFIPSETDLKPIEIALEQALPDVLNADVSELNFKNVINKLGDVMFRYPFSLPPFYIAIIRCLGVLEGLAIQVDPQTRVISEAYPYIASRVLTDSQNDLQEALQRLALTNDGQVRWDRLYELLEKANGTAGYDITKALEKITSYLISNDGEFILNELADEIVDATDNLGTETVSYFISASRAFLVNDEVALVKAYRALSEIFSQTNSNSDDLKDILPEPLPSMKRFYQIASLFQFQEDSDLARFIPLIRKLSQEPRVQRTVQDILARLGERMLSRGLRAALGLKAPDFNNMEEVVSEK